jgi:hypothetical protein
LIIVRRNQAATYFDHGSFPVNLKHTLPHYFMRLEYDKTRD